MLFKIIKPMLIIIATLLASCGEKTYHTGDIPHFPQRVRILILSKYHPEEITIKSTEGKIYLSDREIITRDTSFKVKQVNNEISTYINGKTHITEYLSFTDKNLIRVSLKGLKGERNYRGEMEITAGKKNLEIVLTTPVEEYIHSAAVAETGLLNHKKLKSSNGIKQRKSLIMTMEIAIRSYLFHFRDRHKSSNYEFCDLTHCVHFPGMIKSNLKDKNQKSLTKGIVMMGKDREIIPAYFHSTCGGLLTGPESYWPKHKYIKNFKRGHGKKFPETFLCEESPHYRWEKFVSHRELSDILKKTVKDIKPIYRAKTTLINNLFYDFPGGRAISLEYKDQKGVDYKIPAWKFLSLAGRKLGWNSIKSNYFNVEKKDEGWLFKGNGLGHGIGLCQWGAWHLAQENYSYKEILNFYYDDPKLIKVKYDNED